MYSNGAFLKRNARQAIYDSKFRILLVATGYLLLMYLLTLFAQNLSGYTAFALDYSEKLLNGDVNIDFSWPRVEMSAWIIVFCIILMRIIVRAGFANYMLLSSRGLPAGFKNLFDGFYFPVKVVVMEIIKYFFILAGIFFFIFPGILFAYMFRLAIYILFDNPKMGPIHCLGESMRLMRGRKWELFILDLSFIGWYILENLFAMIRFPIIDVWISPYTGLTYAGYYNSLIGWRGEEKPKGTDGIGQ